MFRASRTSENRHMLILIHLDHTEPPTGTISLPRDGAKLSDEDRLVPFTGWLGMLHVLQEALDPGRVPP
jgi:hypothetical protein